MRNLTFKSHIIIFYGITQWENQYAEMPEAERKPGCHIGTTRSQRPDGPLWSGRGVLVTSAGQWNQSEPGKPVEGSVWPTGRSY